MRDIQLQDTIAKGIVKKENSVNKNLKEIKAVHNNSALDDFLNS